MCDTGLNVPCQRMASDLSLRFSRASDQTPGATFEKRTSPRKSASMDLADSGRRFEIDSKSSAAVRLFSMRVQRNLQWTAFLPLAIC